MSALVACDICRRSHRVGSVAYAFHLSGRDPEDIAAGFAQDATGSQRLADVISSRGPAGSRLTVADIESGYQRDDWLGFGYLGERRSAQDDSDSECPPIAPEQLALSDAAVLAEANRLGWTSDRLFDWLNSRTGRHYADAQMRASAPDASGWLR